VGPHASLSYNNISAEGAKHVGAGLAQCPNLTEVKYVCRCPWADPPPPRPRTCVHVGGNEGSSVCVSEYVCVCSADREREGHACVSAHVRACVCV
jgi:hypothetical protein